MNYLLAGLAQMTIYLLLLLADDFAGLLFAAIIGLICFGVWCVSIITEWIEPSRVSGAYYRYTLSGWLAPIGALIFYAVLRGGFDWMTL